MTRRVVPLVATCLACGLLLLPADASAQRRRAPRVAVGATVIVGSPYYARPFLYDPWYPYYWYPSSPYFGSRYYDAGASLRLQVEPRDAEVFIDGYYAGIVDDFDGVLQRLHLEPGEHELQLFLPGHRTFTQRIYLQPRSTFRVRHTLETIAPGDPQPTRPSGASSGSTATGPRPRSAGPVRGDQAATSRPSEHGNVTVRVQPGDAEVLIDGERWEGTSGDERLVVQLAPGPHRIEVRKQGYRAFSTEFVVRPGETTPMNVALARPR